MATKNTGPGTVNPTTVERMTETAEYLRCEIEHTARRDMIVKLDDFLQSPGLLEACGVFFGEDAEARLRQHIDTSSHRRQS